MAKKESKNWLRKYLLNERKRQGQRQNQSHSLKITSHLTKSHLLKSAKAVAIYVSFGSEVQTKKLIDWCWKRNKTVLIPNTRLGLKNTFFLAYSKKDKLKRSRWGMLEHHLNLKPYPFRRIQVALVPGLGFDPFGYRIGYGGGVYDQLLKKMPQSKSIGLFFETQFLAHIPREKHDQTLDWICTENGLKKSQF